MNVHGFEESNITILMDDGNHTSPTRDNMLAAYRKVVAESVAGDAVFCHYSGHGGKLADDSSDESTCIFLLVICKSRPIYISSRSLLINVAEDGYDETLVPLDYEQNGQIRDDDLYKVLVGSFREGVYCTFVMDCCHSGSVLDLPFQFAADGNSDSMSVPEGFNFGPLMNMATSLLADGDLSNEDMMKIAATCCKIL